VITFTQGEVEGIDQAWNRFNELIEQGPRLGFSSDILLHTYFFSLTQSCMQHIQMCAGGDLMEKTLTEAAQLLQKISRAAAMRRDWETRLAEEPEYNSRKKKCAEFSEEATPEVTKGMKSVGNGRTRNHKCRKTVGTERYFSTFMKANYYKIMKNDIKIN
jgi:hypothetical protein